MAEGDEREILHIVWRDEIPAVEQGSGLARAKERERATRASAEVDSLMIASRGRELDDVLLDERVDVDLLDRLLQLEDLIRVGDLTDRIDGVGDLLLVEHQHFVRWAGVAEMDADQEAVELRLREREGPLILDWVLGG